MTSSLIRALACLLDNSTLLLASDYETQMAFEFQNTLLMVVESIASNQKVLINLHDPIVTFLLPVLMSKALLQEDLL